MSPKSLSFRNIRTSSIETSIKHKFLRSLLRIKRRKTPMTLEGMSQRSRRIKTAAFSSMALAAGPKRGWSRALIFKIRSRVRYFGSMRKKRYVQKPKTKKCIKIKKQKPSTAEISRVDRLRKLVPGGDAMDLCKLLEETAVYAKYLSVQVKVMQKVADAFSGGE